MKIREGFLLRSVGESYVVIPVGENSADFSNVITLNHSGAFVWNCLESDTTREEVIEKMLKEYDVSAEVAERDLTRFVDMLKANRLLEE